MDGGDVGAVQACEGFAHALRALSAVCTLAAPVLRVDARLFESGSETESEFARRLLRERDRDDALEADPGGDQCDKTVDEHCCLPGARAGLDEVGTLEAAILACRKCAIARICRRSVAHRQLCLSLFCSTAVPIKGAIHSYSIFARPSVNPFVFRSPFFISASGSMTDGHASRKSQFLQLLSSGNGKNCPAAMP